MSILIKGIEMPQCCQDCPLNYDQMECAVTGTAWWSDSMVLVGFDSEKERLYDCPLIEVPTPHGRLIDADALIADLVKYQNMLDPESRENARVLSVKSYLTLARGEAIIEAED